MAKVADELYQPADLQVNPLTEAGNAKAVCQVGRLLDHQVIRCPASVCLGDQQFGNEAEREKRRADFFSTDGVH